MISAGTIDTKMTGTSLAAIGLPGICFRTCAKLASAGILKKSAGNLPAATHGPFGSDATSHPPLFSRYQLLLPASKNTSQLVFTTKDKLVPATGASTGSPSNTTRLAGRALTKIAGASFFTRISVGFCVCERRLRMMVSSGIVLTPRLSTAFLICSSTCEACSVSSDGKRVEMSLASVSVTVRVAVLVRVANAISMVPRMAVLAPFGVRPTATRALSV